MPGQKFNWNQFQTEDQGPAKFDWNHFQPEGAAPESDGPSFASRSIKATVDSLPMIGGVVGGALGTPADALTGPAGTMAGAAIGGYLGTATKNLINRYYDPESAPKTATEAYTQPLTGGIEQGLMQGSGEAVAPYVGQAVQAAAKPVAGLAKWAGTKSLSSTFGVKPSVIGEYAKFSDRINAAPSVDALKNISDEFVGKLASDVEAKKLTAQQAQEAYKGLQADLKDAYKTAGYDARDSVTSAQQTLKDAHGARLQQMAGDVYDTVTRLKGDVQEGSGKALDVLENSDKMIKIKPIFEEINSQIERANQAGTKEGAALAKELEDYRDGIAKSAQYSGKINPVDAKRKIQGLDQITTYSPMAGAFDKMKNSAYKAIRSAWDGSVKESVPEYAEAMKPVSDAADLLNRVSQFGDKQSAVGLLQRANAPNQLENRAALDELGKRYKTDFVNGAQPESLPEYKLLQKAQAAQESLRPDRVAGKLDQTLDSSRQKSALDAATTDYGAAQEKLAPFKSLAPNSAGQTMAQQKLAQLGKGGNIELEDMFKKLGSMTDTDFVQAMKDQHTLAAFQKGATNGSRNTLMGALVGFAFGGMGGAAAGGTAGRVVDQWGPAITKKVLDGAIAVSRRPTIAAIRELNLPDPVKRNMIIGLQNYLTKEGASPAPLRSVASDQPQGKAHGGVIQGKARVAGDSKKNDTVPTMLSPGEIVVPRSHAGDPAKAKAFIDSLFAKGPHMSDGGQVPTSGETLGSIIGYPGFPKPKDKPKAMAHGGVVLDPSISKYARERGISYDAAKQYLMKGKKR